MTGFVVVLAATFVVATGCGGDGGGNAGADVKDAFEAATLDVPATVDTVAEVKQDVDTADTQDTQETSQDVVQETVQETIQETIQEVIADTVETSEDTIIATDVTDVASHVCADGTIAGLLTCAEGTVDAMLMEAVVTYVFAQGFFLYDWSTDHGIEVYVGDVWTYPVPAVGDTVMLHATTFSNFHGLQEVTASENLIIMDHAGDAEGATLDLNADPSPTPSEQIESRAVKGTNLTVNSMCANYLRVSYGTLTDIIFRVFDLATLCPGAKFDLKKGVINEFDGEYNVHTFVADDIANIITSSCTTNDNSNWGFEETGTDDPPADFYKGTCSFTALRTTAEYHSGSASCALTWTSTDQQDLYISEYLPATSNTMANFNLWVKDNDPAGRVRMAIAFYKANKELIGNFYSDEFSDDIADWVNPVFGTQAPADTAFVRAFVRMYDVGATFTTATVYIDDWNLELQ